MLVIIVGIALISPLFLRQAEVDAKQVDAKQIVMLTFSILESDDVLEWCNNVSSILNTYNISATVFVVGRLAEQHPQALLYFSDNVDIGSETYSHIDLTTISDYSLKLQEVEKGKAAVDNAGHLYSKSFRAPYGATDQDIYSLLSRSDILADFSYKNQYNVYQNGQFVRYDATAFEGRDYSPDFFIRRDKTSKPLIINFDNTYPTSSIESFLSRLKTGDFRFVNASGLVGVTLTLRSLSIRLSEIAQVELRLKLEEDDDDLFSHCMGSVAFMEER